MSPRLLLLITFFPSAVIASHSRWIRMFIHANEYISKHMYSFARNALFISMAINKRTKKGSCTVAMWPHRWVLAIMLFVMTSLSLCVVVLAHVMFLYALMLKIALLMHEHRTIDKQTNKQKDIDICCSLDTINNSELLKTNFFNQRLRILAFWSFDHLTIRLIAVYNI